MPFDLPPDGSESWAGSLPFGAPLAPRVMASTSTPGIPIQEERNSAFTVQSGFQSLGALAGLGG
ncbi:MAG: hypothetical protein LBQ90_02645 [Synergistaceae bacterium]|nr:hypothetical protein [Synergistaceae bacterium]